MRNGTLLKSRQRIVSLLIAASMAAGGGVLVAQDDDRHAGTWKLNVEKSSFNPGPPLLSQTRTYQPLRDRRRGEGMKARVETVGADGKRTTGGYVAFFYDESNYPAPGDDNAVTLSLIRVDASTLVATLKLGRVTMMTTRNVVSADGKVMKLTERGTSEDGQPLFNVLMYDKQ